MIDRPHASPQTVAPTAHALSHSYAAKSPLVAMGPPYLFPKLPLLVDRFPNPTTCLIPGPVQPTTPNRIHVRLGIFPQGTERTHRPTDRPTDGWRERPMTIGRLRSIEI